MVTLVLENCEEFNIPKKYIVKKKVRRNKLKTLWVSKEYLNLIENYIGFTWEGRTKKDIINRFLNALDVTQIVYKNKNYFVNYIEQTFNVLGSDNILQKIEVTDKLIKFVWDIDKRNLAKGKYYYSSTLYLHERYKNIKLNGYEKIIYWK